MLAAAVAAVWSGYPFLLFMTISVVTSNLDHQCRKLIPYPRALHLKGGYIIIFCALVMMSTRLHHAIPSAKSTQLDRGLMVIVHIPCLMTPPIAVACKERVCAFRIQVHHSS